MPDRAKCPECLSNDVGDAERPERAVGPVHLAAVAAVPVAAVDVLGEAVALEAQGVAGVEGLVYDVQAVDPLTLAGGCLALAFVAVAASAIPAARAVRVPPVLALRSE